jgi:hypothetical protein
MILLMRNHVSEFVPGCDYTAVRSDAELVVAIARRAGQCLRMRVSDGSLAEARYWDASPECVGSPDPETAEPIEEALERGDGWAVLDDNATVSDRSRSAPSTCRWTSWAADSARRSGTPLSLPNYARFDE